MTGLGDELERLAKIATTMQRDVSPEDDQWFRTHPFRRALSDRGITTVAPVAAAIIEWLVERPLESLEDDLTLLIQRQGTKMARVDVYDANDRAAPWPDQITADYLWVVADSWDDAPRGGTRRVEWAVQMPAEDSPFPVVFPCDEPLARRCAAADPDLTVVKRFVTTYEDGVSMWETEPELPVAPPYIGPASTHPKGPAT